MAVTRIIEKNDATATLPEYEEFCDWLRHDGRHPDAPSSMHISWKSLAEARPTARPRLSMAFIQAMRPYMATALAG